MLKELSTHMLAHVLGQKNKNIATQGIHAGSILDKKSHEAESVLKGITHTDEIIFSYENAGIASFRRALNELYKKIGSKHFGVSVFLKGLSMPLSGVANLVKATETLKIVQGGKSELKEIQSIVLQLRVTSIDSSNTHPRVMAARYVTEQSLAEATQQGEYGSCNRPIATTIGDHALLIVGTGIGLLSDASSTALLQALHQTGETVTDQSPLTSVPHAIHNRSGNAREKIIEGTQQSSKVVPTTFLFGTSPQHFPNVEKIEVEMIGEQIRQISTHSEALVGAAQFAIESGLAPITKGVSGPSKALEIVIDAMLNQNQTLSETRLKLDIHKKE